MTLLSDFELDEDAQMHFAEGDDASVDSSLSDEDEGLRQEVIAKIERLALTFVARVGDSLASCLPTSTPDISGDFQSSSKESTSARRKVKKVEMQLADRRKAGLTNELDVKTLRYPGTVKSRGASLKPFAQLLRVLELLHQGLKDNIPCTKRDMYYRDVQLFGTQAVVDRLVDDVAATLNLQRSDLNVRAASKGLLCGASISIELCSGDTVAGSNTEGILIPVGEDIERFEIKDDIAWVLIVEKEAVFQTLCRTSLATNDRLPGPGIIITGKGYPDVATRELVKTFSENLPSTVPILGLVDGDPYGLDILSVYKSGSHGMRHENGKLAATRLEGVGLWASDLSNLNIEKSEMIPITKHDVNKALVMLRRPDHVMPPSWKRELAHMLHSRRKAEIEVLTAAKQTMTSLLGDYSGTASVLTDFLVLKIRMRISAHAEDQLC